MTDDITDVFTCALLAKPFVILTGNSGTGKTRIALRLAQRLGPLSDGKSEIELQVDSKGRVTNKSEDDLKAYCTGGNRFRARIDGQEADIRIELASYLEFDDKKIMTYISTRESTDVTLQVAKESSDKRYELIPVGAGWVDPRPLLGYSTPFGEGGKKTYQVTDAVRLILRAFNPRYRNQPFFLILDEMNLSHVERYFSPFLSLMEASRSSAEAFPIVESQDLPLIREVLSGGAGSGSNASEVEALKYLVDNNKPLCVPPNLHIIGTVNVDETTYMFSPKVLDRAHVIELRTALPGKYIGDPEEYEFKFSRPSGEMLSTFSASIDRRGKGDKGSTSIGYLKEVVPDEARNKVIIEGVSKVLDGIYTLLEPVGFDFGFRPINETVDYIATAMRMDDKADTAAILDMAVLQKILPKIHGSKRRLSGCLSALIEFLAGKGAEFNLGPGKIIRVEAPGFDLPMSRDKVGRMRTQLDHTGHTSFIS